MALSDQGGGWCSLLLVLLTLTSAGTGEVLLIHESGKGTSWGYSHLPSTFPLTWSQARSACEAVPGSMLARVDGWQAEAAVEEYLREAAFTEPVWLANRQTLPEVLEDEQREMNHIGNAGVLGNDLSMGGDVGVTLRCAVYRVGVGLVHELCSDAAVSAALCVQRLSNERPLLKVCPASPHRQWLLVNSHTQTTTSQPHQTSVSVIGLHQCHHHHHHHRGHLARASCRPQEGWELTACIHEVPAPKHQQKSHTAYRQQAEGVSLGAAPVIVPTDAYNDNYERELEEKEFLSLFPQQEYRRRKRSAEPQSTQEVQTSNVTPSHMRSIPTHGSVFKNQESDVDDKVMLYITGYKKSKDPDAIKPQHDARVETRDEKYDTDPSQYDASATRLKDKHTSSKAKIYKPETVFDPTINEIETEAESDHHADTQEIGPSAVAYDSAVHYDESEEVSEIHIKTTTVHSTNPSESQGNEEIEDLKTQSTGHTGITFKVGSGPIFVHGPEPQNDTNNTDRNFRALLFPEDSTRANSSKNQLPDDEKDPVIPSIDLSSERSTSGIEKTTPSKETTTTPSRPIIFPRTENDDPVPEESVNNDPSFNENPENQTQSAAQPTKETTHTGPTIDMVSEVQNSESTPVSATTPEVSEMKMDDLNDADDVEGEDTQEGSEDPDTNTPKAEESTETPIISNTSLDNVRQETSSDSSTLSRATTEKPKAQGTRLLITQIIKNIFG